MAIAGSVSRSSKGYGKDVLRSILSPFSLQHVLHECAARHLVLLGEDEGIVAHLAQLEEDGVDGGTA